MTERTPTRKARTGTTSERILTAGLATAACLGVVGLLGTRMVSAQEAAAQEAAAPSAPVLLTANATPDTTSARSLTAEDLATYAALLSAERERLDAYRAELRAAAKKVNAAVATSELAPTIAKSSKMSNTATSGGSGKTNQTGKRKQSSVTEAAPLKPTPAKPKPATAPAPPMQKAPAMVAAPAPQSASKGS